MNISPKFLKHEPCPECGSRDNLARYSDGHAYCFGCGYVEPGIPCLQQKQKTEEKQQDYGPPTFGPHNLFDYSLFPVSAISWLLKFITEEEIQTFGIYWDDESNSICLPVPGITGVQTVLQKRYMGLNKGMPKYLTQKILDEPGLFKRPTNDPLDIVVFTEDILSAIKVSRIVPASPLLGCNLSSKALKWAAMHFNRGILWLDPDKQSNAVREAARGLSFNFPISTAFSYYDPKYYSTEGLSDILGPILSAIEIT